VAAVVLASSHRAWRSPRSAAGRRHRPPDTQSELEAVAEKVRAARPALPTSSPTDLAQPEVTAELAGQPAVEAFGRLDIVVNNVGGTMPNGLLTTSTKDLKSRVHLQRRHRPRVDHRLRCR